MRIILNNNLHAYILDNVCVFYSTPLSILLNNNKRSASKEELRNLIYDKELVKLGITKENLKDIESKMPFYDVTWKELDYLQPSVLGAFLCRDDLNLCQRTKEMLKIKDKLDFIGYQNRNIKHYAWEWVDGSVRKSIVYRKIYCFKTLRLIDDKQPNIEPMDSYEYDRLSYPYGNKIEDYFNESLDEFLEKRFNYLDNKFNALMHIKDYLKNREVSDGLLIDYTALENLIKGN
jgi:hypothetical protein